MGKVDNKCLEIIMDNAAIAETSISKFIYKCCLDVGGNYDNYPSATLLAMVKALLHVLVDSCGSWSDIVNEIVEVERRFKWDNFDYFNADHNISGDNFLSTEHGTLTWIYGYLVNSPWEVLGSMDLWDQIHKYIPNVDFTKKHSIYKDLNSPIYPLNVCDWSYSQKELFSNKISNDAYVGVIVSKNIYPEADSSALSDLHNAQFPAVFNVPINQSTFSSCQTTSCDLSKINNPGLIYVPVKQFVSTISAFAKKNGQRWRCNIETLLPKNVLELHSLPTMEI